MNIRMDGKAAAAAYASAFQYLRSLPGFDQQQTLKAEAGTILKRWAGATKVVTEDSLLRWARLRSLRGLGLTQFGEQGDAVTINAGVRRRGNVGRVWLKTGAGKMRLTGNYSAEGGTFSPVNRHLKPAQWLAVQASTSAYGNEYPKQKEAVHKSQGLSRQSVIQIADDLGIDLAKVAGGGVSPAGVAKARAAIASTGIAYKNGSGKQGGDGTKCFIDILNRLPWNTKIGMANELVAILSNRAKYIETSYQMGAMESARTAARAFPNILRVKQEAVASSAAFDPVI